MADGYAKNTSPGPGTSSVNGQEEQVTTQKKSTGSGDFFERLVLLSGHEADDGKDGESRNETGARIDDAHHNRLAGNQNKITVIIVRPFKANAVAMGVVLEHPIGT